MRKLFCDLIWIEKFYCLFPRQNAVFFDPSYVNPVLNKNKYLIIY